MDGVTEDMKVEGAAAAEEAVTTATGSAEEAAAAGDGAAEGVAAEAEEEAGAAVPDQANDSAGAEEAEEAVDEEGEGQEPDGGDEEEEAGEGEGGDARGDEAQTGVVGQKRQREEGPVKLGFKTFKHGNEAVNYFQKLITSFSPNQDLNEYEHTVMLALLREGHRAAAEKEGAGVRAFQIRRHQHMESTCFHILRVDGSVIDFSYLKCIQAIFPNVSLPNLKSRRDSGGGGRGKGEGRGRRGGRGRGGRGRGGRGRR